MTNQTSHSEIAETLRSMLDRVMKYPLLEPEEADAVEAAIEELEN